VHCTVTGGGVVGLVHDPFGVPAAIHCSMIAMSAAGSCPVAGIGAWASFIRKALRWMTLLEGSAGDGAISAAYVVRLTPAEGVAPE
jgi:hypothetical protein